MEIAFPPNTKKSGNVMIALKEEVELRKQNSECYVWTIEKQFF